MRPASAFALAFALAGCADDFSPPSLLDGPRVLAILAEPLDVGPGEQVVLTPALYLPDGAAAGASWSFCPFARGGACAVPACETTLAAEADGSVKAVPSALAAACAASLGLPPSLPDVLETRFRLKLDAGPVADMRVPLHAAPPEARNRPPVLAAVEVSASGWITARIDPASLETYLDAAGRSRTEEAVTSFFVTSGELDSDRAAGTEASVEWTSAGVPAVLYVVTRDLRGGQAVRGPIGLAP